MTERLQEIRDRVEAATDGPWDIEQAVLDEWYWSPLCVGPPNVKSYSRTAALTDDEQGSADATFIAHARSDIPWLLAEVERKDAALRQIATIEYTDDFVLPTLVDCIEIAGDALGAETEEAEG